MENTDIEDGEILEDESNSSEQTFQNKDQKQEEHLLDTKAEVKNNFENYFHKELKNPHNDVHKGSRRERFSELHKKRKRIDSEDKYYSKVIFFLFFPLLWTSYCTVGWYRFISFLFSVNCLDFQGVAFWNQFMEAMNREITPF